MQFEIGKLAETYGKKEYASQNELYSSPLFNLVARTIYGEETGANVISNDEIREKEEQGQDIIAWVIIERVLGQNSIYTHGKDVTLFNVLTTDKQFTTLQKENNNSQSYTAKTEYEWPGWEHAFENAYWVAEILGNIDGNSTQEELDAARRRLEERLGKNPAQGYENYRTRQKFENDVQTRTENGIKVFYWGNERIISQYDDGVHVFFNTVRE